MSLLDVDRNSEDRGSPQPNHSDQLADGAVKSHKTISTHYGTDADTNPGRLQMGNKQIIGHDGTTPITLYGYNPALDAWGFFATQAGVDVTTNTDLSLFIFNSTQDTFKIVYKGTATLPGYTATYPGAGNFAQATASIPVSLPETLAYTPSIIASINIGGNGVPLTYVNNGVGASGAFWQNIKVESISTSSVIFRGLTVTTGTGSNIVNPAIPITYYVLQETSILP